MPLRVCIVSNDPVSAGELFERLRGWGHEPVPATPESVARVLPPPHLFLVDLPEGSLLETVPRLQKKRETRHIPIIVLSAYPELEFELGNIFDFLSKPIDLLRLQDDCAVISRGATRPVRVASDLEEEDRRLFCDFLVDRSGLRFDSHNIKFLTRGIRSRMQVLHIESFRKYYDYLSRHHETRHELQKLVQLLTVGETYFFRYRGQFDVLGRVVRKAFAEGGEDGFNVWSAGCSTGEEPYSIAMAIMDSVPFWQYRKFSVKATDINKRSLRRATEGVYRPWAMRAMDQRQIGRYFDESGALYRIRDAVKEHVQFFHLNLQTSRIPVPDKGLAELDAIFCRNVLIYFDADATHRIVERLGEALKPGGYLFLGHAEMLSPPPAPFERRTSSGMFYYRKKKPVSVPFFLPAGAVAVSTPPPEDTGFPPFSVSSPEAEVEELLREARHRVDLGDFPGAVPLLDEITRRMPDHAGALVIRGLISLFQGRPKEALTVCEAALRLDDLLPEGYYLKALLYQSIDQPAKAIAEYRKANLLDMKFVMSHYRLGKLFLRLDRLKDGRRELRTCVRVLQRQSDLGPVPFSGGMPRDALLEQVRSELAAAGVSDGG